MGGREQGRILRNRDGGAREGRLAEMKDKG